jgi:hypothetical protein
VSRVVIYFEGGGRANPNARRLLRQGLTAFLRNAYDGQFEVVCCGDTAETIRRWRDHPRERGVTALLLVDSDTLPAGARGAHLAAHYGDLPRDADESRCHLMVCLMETWLVADPAALQAHYKSDQSLALRRLPARDDLEPVSKQEILDALTAATSGTRKGAYRKIQDGAAILGHADPRLVRLRCRHCGLLLDALTD